MSGVVYTAYRTVGVVKEFTCGGCKFTSKVEITARGAGQTTSGRFGDQGASNQVTRDAAANAEKLTEIYLKLCVCPKCGWRDPVESAKYKKRFLIVGAVSFGILALGAVMIALGLYVGGGVVALFGLIGAIVVPAMSASTFGGAKKNVKFLHDAPASDGAIG
jgi:hypothetical protein